MPNYTKLKLNSISASPETDKQQNNKTKCCLLFGAQKSAFHSAQHLTALNKFIVRPNGLSNFGTFLN